MRIGTLIILFMASSPLAAESSNDPCGSLATQAEMNICAGQEYQKADQQLNLVYKQVLAPLNKEQTEKLREAQRAWIAFRDANCIAQAFDYQGGSIYPTIYNGCLTEVTKTRIRELNQVYLSAPEAAPLVNTEDLIGKWQSVEKSYGVELSFGVKCGVYYFLSHFNGIPAETGQWQLKGNQLMITANDGKVLHIYEPVTLENGILSLYEQHEVQQYQKQPEKRLQEMKK